MAELKTKPTASSVTEFIAKVKDETTRKDCATLIKLMKRLTKKPPVMWGPTMVGFGSYHYVYASGHSGDSFLVGFSPRKPALTLYVTIVDRYPALMKKLGKYKAGKSCVYVKSLADVDLTVLEELIEKSIVDLMKMHKTVPKKS